MDGTIGDGDRGATGAQFGKYRIVRKIGEGAFGSVYEALLPGPMGFAKRVAIKRIRPTVVQDDPKFVQSMINEARIGGLLHHANIVDIFEFGQEGPHYYLAMEFVDGATLDGIMRLCSKRRVLLPRFAVVDLAMQVCRGLHYAHSFRDPGGQRLELIHRDMKPSNVMVDREGTAKICDFGIAKAASNLYKTTTEGFVKGTPRYMSPEQITGQGELTVRSDVFSLGVVLFEVITGRGLFSADSLISLMHKILEADLVQPLDEAEAAFPGSADLLRQALALEDLDALYTFAAP
jgi:serine/threonine-protein kinase